MIKVLYILKHKTGEYLKSPAHKQFTANIQQAFRAATYDEAARWKQKMPVPLAWDVNIVEYDTRQGKVITED